MFGKRTRPEELSDAQRRRRLLTQLGVQAGVIVLLAAMALVWVISKLTGESIVIPRTPQGVLESVKVDDHYAWTSETVRRVTLGGQQVEQQALRSAVVDLKLNRFQATVAGVLPEFTTFVSPGTFTSKLTESDQQEGRKFTPITDYCAGKPPVAAKTLEYPTPQDILAANPRFGEQKDNASMFGERAWEIEFTPTPTILRKVLWLDFFDQANAHDRSLDAWVMSRKERAAIQQGRVKADWAYVLVSRAEPRRMLILDMRFRVEGGSAYRVLSVQRLQTDRPLAELASGVIKTTVLDENGKVRRDANGNPVLVTCTGKPIPNAGGREILQQR